MSDYGTQEELYSAFFGDADPPSYFHIPSLWDFQEGLSDNTDLRDQVLREYAERHQEHGLSELIKLRDYLSEMHGELKQRGEKPWKESLRLEKKVKGITDPESGEWVREPSATADEEAKFRRLRDRGASLLSKAEIVRYRLAVLELYLWEKSVRGRYSTPAELEKHIMESNHKINEVKEDLIKRKAMLCVLSDIVDIELLDGKREACEKVVKMGISKDIGDEVGSDSIRRYLDKEADNFASNMIELKKEIDKWKREEDVRNIYRKIKRVRDMP